MIRKLKTGEYRLYSCKRDPATGGRRHLGTFNSFEEAARHHERLVQLHFSDNFYINRAGSALPARQKHILTHAKEELREVFHEPARPASHRK